MSPCPSSASAASTIEFGGDSFCTSVVETEEYIPDIDDFLPSPPKPPGALATSPSAAGLRPALALFALFWLVSSYDWRVERSAGLWASGHQVYAEHEYWRLLTALCAHADVGHLLANAPLFLIFGWLLYSFFGSLVFPGVAVLIGALSNLITVYFYPAHAQLLGASGMVYGMVALWLVLYVRFETSYSRSHRLMRAVAVSLLLLFPTSFVAQTSYLAHFTGFILGLGFGFALGGPKRRMDAGNSLSTPPPADALPSQPSP